MWRRWPVFAGGLLLKPVRAVAHVERAAAGGCVGGHLDGLHCPWEGRWCVRSSESTFECGR
jgi:hypothetical protein